MGAFFIKTLSKIGSIWIEIAIDSAPFRGRSLQKTPFSPGKTMSWRGYKNGAPKGIRAISASLEIPFEFVVVSKRKTA